MSEPSVADRLFAEGHAFDFFQAVRLLERLEPERRPVGRDGPPGAEAVRFVVHQALTYPSSQIYEVRPPSADARLPVMAVRFFGLTGESGVLPHPYTELILHQALLVKGEERYALRDWLDLFNHRLLSLFYRAWEKYRFAIPYERGEYDRPEPDPFTRCLLSFVGLGMPPLRNRLRVAVRTEDDEEARERALARIDDLGLLHYAGLLAQRPRNAVGLRALLADYFQLPVQVEQFRGQWLALDRANQSCLGRGGSNDRLGTNLVAGARVWEMQSKFRLRLGPLGYDDFVAFLPDRAPAPERKAYFLLVHLARLYVGADLDFDVQLVLRARDVPACRMGKGDGLGARLGWNTWVLSRPRDRDAEDAVFAGDEVVWLKSSRPAD